MELNILASGSKGNLYLLKTKKGDLLIEAGLPISQIKKKLDYKFNNILGCLVTHEHGDHARAMLDIAELGIPVYTSKGTILGSNTNHYNYNTIKAKKEFSIGPFKILPFETEHDVLEPLGFLIEYEGDRLLFATDTYYLKYRFKDLTMIAIECNYVESVIYDNLSKENLYRQKRVFKSHMSLENMIEFLKANDLSKVKEINLIHLSDSNSDVTTIEREVRKVYEGDLIIN